MPKRKVERITLRREEVRGPPGPSPLLVLAGLPEATAEIAARTINNSGLRWRAISSAFPTRDQGFYVEARAILDLAKLTCDFAMAGPSIEERLPDPSRIVVAYVGASDADRLWSAFGHAVWPKPLIHPDWSWPAGRHWRHEIEVVNLVLQRAIRELESDATEAVRLRLEARRSDDVLLLPARNFHIDPHERLVDRFDRFMAGTLGIDGVVENVRTERFPFTRLASFFRKMGGAGKSFAVDARDLVFAKANHGQDGNHHDIAADETLDEARLRRELEGRFRFGTPLVPAGFQHDVQRDWGAALVAERFDCTIKGEISVSGDHANVFPNDVVTAGDFTQVKK
jgi:hypothetical protein